MQDGIITPTIEAHRLIYYAQENGPKGSNVKALTASYKSYFEDAQPPASMGTLPKTANTAGLDEVKVKEYLESGEDKMTIKNQIRMTNGEIDGVPHIVICGRKRDFKIDGAVDEEKYINTFIQVGKEFN